MAISSGVYSLLGVMVGALGTGGFQLGLAVRSERRDLLAAKRLVDSELSETVSLLDALHNYGDDDEPLTDDVLHTIGKRDTWDTYAERLAHERSIRWREIDAVYLMLKELAEGLAHSRTARGQANFLRDLHDDVRDARKMLQVDSPPELRSGLIE